MDGVNSLWCLLYLLVASPKAIEITEERKKNIKTVKATL